eukprot:521977_1
MTTVLSESFIVDKILVVITPITLIHNFILLIYHIHTLRKRNNDTNLPKLENTILQKLSIISISSICIYLFYLIIIDDFYNEFGFNHIQCRILVDISLVLFGNSRFIVYFLFFQRLVDIFKNSAFEFKHLSIRMSYILLITAYIICFVYVILFGNGIYSELSDSCIANFTWWFTLIFSFFDVFVCTLIQVLFARKLLSVTRLTDNNEHKNRYQGMILILTKSTMLAFIAIITNELALVFTAIFLLPSLWTVINSVVNCWCIILMFAVHSNCYNVICKKFTTCVTIKCLYCFACDCCCKINKMVYQKPEIEDTP